MQITVELDENPSTGYRWEFTTTNCRVVSDDYVPMPQPPGPEFRVGGGGTRVLTLEIPDHHATWQLTGNHWHPWDHTDCVDSVLIGGLSQ